jgi:hypothetical protein
LKKFSKESTVTILIICGTNEYSLSGDFPGIVQALGREKGCICSSSASEINMLFVPNRACADQDLLEMLERLSLSKIQIIIDY